MEPTCLWFTIPQILLVHRNVLATIFHFGDEKTEIMQENGDAMDIEAGVADW